LTKTVKLLVTEIRTLITQILQICAVADHSLMRFMRILSDKISWITKNNEDFT